MPISVSCARSTSEAVRRALGLEPAGRFARAPGGCWKTTEELR